MHLPSTRSLWVLEDLCRRIGVLLLLQKGSKQIGHRKVLGAQRFGSQQRSLRRRQTLHSLDLLLIFVLLLLYHCCFCCCFVETICLWLMHFDLTLFPWRAPSVPIVLVVHLISECCNSLSLQLLLLLFVVGMPCCCFIFPCNWYLIAFGLMQRTGVHRRKKYKRLKARTCCWPARSNWSGEVYAERGWFVWRQQ